METTQPQAGPNTAHTPTPWILDADNIQLIRNDKKEAVCTMFAYPEREANARLIVKAVNNHDRLVETLEGIVYWKKNPKARDAWITKAQSLLFDLRQ